LGVSFSGLGVKRIFAFSSRNHLNILLVGADQLEKLSENIFRMLVASSPLAPISLQTPAQDAAIDRFHSLDYELEASYDPDLVLANVLEIITSLVFCDAAYIAIRSGNNFRVQAVWHCPERMKGLDISLEDDELLEQMVNGRTGIIVDKDQQEHPQARPRKRLLEICIDQASGSWMGVPIQIGERVIGYIALLSNQYQAFDTNELQQVSYQMTRLAYPIENAIVFAEAARYLQRLAMLNELASVVALGIGTDEAARRVIHHLRRSFATDHVQVYLRSLGGDELYAYTAQGREILNWQQDTTSNLRQAIESGHPIRFENINSNTHELPQVQAIKSEMIVPLRYQGRIIGALALQNEHNVGFSLQDEQLIIVIASQLASLIENVRLNEETKERALRLQDSVRQLRAARETALDITSDLDLDVLLKRVVHRVRELVDAKGAELGLFDPRDNAIHVVVAENPWYEKMDDPIPLMAGVAGRVAALGQPFVVTDYNSWQGRLMPDQKAPFKTVAGVPLLYGDRSTTGFEIIGTLVVQDDRDDKEFTPEDLEILELLAPQVAVSIRNARLYQELQERIEAQHLAEARLLRSARLAAVGEMAAGVAHELNNPLTTVAGFAELTLEEIPPSSTVYSDLELILREALRARDVVRRLLDFSRPMDEIRAMTDINELIRDTLSLVNHQIRTHGVTADLQYGRDLPWVSVDPNQIKQVLLNLIHNALQAMTTGGKLTIKTTPEQRENKHWVTVAIIDTGIGISPENIDRVFEPFFTTRSSGSGTGLGLSISYGIVTDHGGYIEIESELGQGSQFTIYLPVEASDV